MLAALARCSDWRSMLKCEGSNKVKLGKKRTVSALVRLVPSAPGSFSGREAGAVYRSPRCSPRSESERGSERGGGEIKGKKSK